MLVRHRLFLFCFVSPIYYFGEPKACYAGVLSRQGCFVSTATLTAPVTDSLDAIRIVPNAKLLKVIKYFPITERGSVNPRASCARDLSDVVPYVEPSQ